MSGILQSGANDRQCAFDGSLIGPLNARRGACPKPRCTAHAAGGFHRWNLSSQYVLLSTTVLLQATDGPVASRVVSGLPSSKQRLLDRSSHQTPPPPQIPCSHTALRPDRMVRTFTRRCPGERHDAPTRTHTHTHTHTQSLPSEVSSFLSIGNAAHAHHGWEYWGMLIPFSMHNQMTHYGTMS